MNQKRSLILFFSVKEISTIRFIVRPTAFKITFNGIVLFIPGSFNRKLFNTYDHIKTES